MFRSAHAGQASSRIETGLKAKLHDLRLQNDGGFGFRVSRYRDLTDHWLEGRVKSFGTGGAYGASVEARLWVRLFDCGAPPKIHEQFAGRPGIRFGTGIKSLSGFASRLSWHPVAAGSTPRCRNVGWHFAEGLAAWDLAKIKKIASFRLLPAETCGKVQE